MSSDTLTKLYYPLTSVPFEKSKSYMEVAPCDALKPYIRCFWGSTENCSQRSQRLIIPDTCMDIIFNYDYSKNMLGSLFCAVDEHSYFSSKKSDNISVHSTFAIRFYSWSAVLFSDRYFVNTKNKTFATDEFFCGLRREMEPMLMSVSSLSERCRLAEKYLLKRLNVFKQNNDFMNAVYDIIHSNATIGIRELAHHNAISQRQLERIFNSNMGISPKAFSSLVRYQLVWQELCLNKNADILDLTEKYGYADQSHLQNEFKKFHLMTPREGLAYAKL